MRTRLLSVALVALAVGAVTSSPAQYRERSHLRVLGAASLADVITVLVSRYDAASVETAFGGSSTLARQLRDGAPADVFLSASPDWIDYLREADVLAGDAIVLARNRLVCIAPQDSPLGGGAVVSPTALLERIGPAGRVAIADPGVPAGEYARDALRHLDLLPSFERHLVGQRDVRAVLNAVEQNALDAGFVYSTDAKIASVQILFAFDPTTHPPIEYQAAAIRGASNAEAAHRFLAFLTSAEARALLVDAGFEVP